MLRLQQQQQQLTTTTSSILQNTNRSRDTKEDNDSDDDSYHYYDLSGNYIWEPPNVTTTSVPFLESHGLQHTEVIDEYYNDLLHLFTLKKTACCGDDGGPNHHDDEDDREWYYRTHPYDDEIVLHVRQYRKEKATQGFEEMDPDQVALLFQPYLNETDRRIAIVSFKPADRYAAALRYVGFTKVRQVQLRNGMEDFC
jgi:hypothetical protein